MRLGVALGYQAGVMPCQAKLRARWLLSKLDSDIRTGTDYFSNKFIGKIDAVFSTHPRKVMWLSFLRNDIPLLELPKLVLDIAIESNLNKSQTKAVGKLAARPPLA